MPLPFALRAVPSERICRKESEVFFSNLLDHRALGIIQREDGKLFDRLQMFAQERNNGDLIRVFAGHCRYGIIKDRPVTCSAPNQKARIPERSK